jgi:hypothetical protein
LNGVRDDGGAMTVSFAQSRESLGEAVRRIMSTQLLPGERPELLTGPDRIEPAADGGWLVRGTLTVRNTPTALDLLVTADVDGDPARIAGGGVLDRAATGLRAPRWLIGRWIDVRVDAVLTR